MKNKSIKIALILFIVVNTSFLWERLPSGWDFLLFIILGFMGLILFVSFIMKLGGVFIDKFSDRNNNISVIIIGLVLSFCLFFPLGILKSTDFDPEYYLKASREGTANCTTSVILGVDNTFIERSICFGMHRKSGTYKIKNDTVYITFNNLSNYKKNETIGIIKRNTSGNTEHYGTFMYFMSPEDDKPLKLTITESNTNFFGLNTK